MHSNLLSPNILVDPQKYNKNKKVQNKSAISFLDYYSTIKIQKFYNPLFQFILTRKLLFNYKKNIQFLFYFTE